MLLHVVWWMFILGIDIGGGLLGCRVCVYSDSVDTSSCIIILMYLFFKLIFIGV